MQEIGDRLDAREYLRARLGGLAPALETMQTWSRPYWRARNADMIRLRRIPTPVSVPGQRKRMWRRADLDAYVAGVLGNRKRSPT